MAVVEMRNQTVVWHQEAHKQGIRFPGKVGVILPIGIICITVWGIRLWFILAHGIGML